MSIENLDIVTSIQNYIAELERTANVSGGEKPLNTLRRLPAQGWSLSLGSAVKS